MNKTLELACYVVNRHNDLFNGVDITCLRLQKLIYFINLYYYLTFNRLYLDEEFIAGDFGPYLESVSDEFSYAVSSSIPYTNNYFIKDKETGYIKVIKFDDCRVGSNLKILVDKVLNKFIPLETYQLVRITMSHTPWKIARCGNHLYMENKVKINTKDLIDFYKTLRNK